MSNYFSYYCTLISSVAQLELCRQAQTLGELLACIKKLWNCNQLSDDELISEISRLNQTPIAIPDIQLAGHWLPCRYQPKRRLVNWLLPVGHATEPFHDETISRYRQQLLLNQIIQPCTSLGIAQQQAEKLVAVKPAGFIFHLSRCGSTLISGCLSELETTCVFSESSLLTELLLDGSLSSTEQRLCLRAFINLQATAFPDRQQMIIKWNAWDIFRWDVIRAVYPEVPVIFLIRNPLEVLASHHRSAGRHMSGDPTLANYHPVFSSCANTDAQLEKRMQVLHAILCAMQDFYPEQSGRLIDYQQLSAGIVTTLVQFFGINIDEIDARKIQARMQFHSKNVGQIFAPDTVNKRSLFTQKEQEEICMNLASIYNQLLTIKQNTIRSVIDA